MLCQECPVPGMAAAGGIGRIFVRIPTQFTA